MTYYLNWDLRHESQPALKKKSKHEIKLSKDEISHLIYALWGIDERGHELCNLKQLNLEADPWGCPDEKANQKKYDLLNDLANKLERFVMENK